MMARRICLDCPRDLWRPRSKRCPDCQLARTAALSLVRDGLKSGRARPSPHVESAAEIDAMLATIDARKRHARWVAR